MQPRKIFKTHGISTASFKYLHAGARSCSTIVCIQMWNYISPDYGNQNQQSMFKPRLQVPTNALWILIGMPEPGHGGVNDMKTGSKKDCLFLVCNLIHAEKVFLRLNYIVAQPSRVPFRHLLFLPEIGCPFWSQMLCASVPQPLQPEPLSIENYHPTLASFVWFKQRLESQGDWSGAYINSTTSRYSALFGRRLHFRFNVQAWKLRGGIWIPASAHSDSSTTI